MTTGEDGDQTTDRDADREQHSDTPPQEQRDTASGVAESDKDEESSAGTAQDEARSQSTGTAGAAPHETNRAGNADDSGSDGLLGDEQAVQDLEHHINELRRRLLYVFACFAVATGGAFYYSSEILTWLRTDLDVTLHALTAPEVFYTQLVLSAIIGFFVTLPFTMYHAIQFMKPGLKPKEYRVMRNYLPFFIVLFLAGSAFAYELVVKMSLGFFQDITAAADVNDVWGLKATLLFALKLSAVSGVLFQLPLVSLVLAHAGMLTTEQMKAYRGHVIVGILIIAAVATPPDLLTQTLVTVPVIGLYQLSIWLVSRVDQ